MQTQHLVLPLDIDKNIGAKRTLRRAETSVPCVRRSLVTKVLMRAVLDSLCNTGNTFVFAFLSQRLQAFRV